MGVIEDDLDITGEYRWPKNKIRNSVEYDLLRNSTIPLYGVYYLYFYTSIRPIHRIMRTI